MHVVVASGWPGCGKSTIADAVALELGGAVASFDWLMSALRSFPDLWGDVELPVDRQRRIGWALMSRLAEQQLRRGTSVVMDLVARPEVLTEWRELADRYGASFSVIECVCRDEAIHRERVQGRVRAIPGWYELEWGNVVASREHYVPLPDPKLVIDAVDPLADNVERALRFLRTA
ncbi:MAG: AAA family ATPase [Acidimicrobiia bacterium]